jgi:hypothetical protein
MQDLQEDDDIDTMLAKLSMTVPTLPPKPPPQPTAEDIDLDALLASLKEPKAVPTPAPPKVAAPQPKVPAPPKVAPPQPKPNPAPVKAATKTTPASETAQVLSEDWRKGITWHNTVVDGYTLDVVKDMLAEGWNINHKHSSGDTLLNTACQEDEGFKQTRFVEFLINAGADVHIANNKGDTPLHSAAAEKNADDIVEALVAAGADIFCKNAKGKTPLSIAEDYGYKKILKVLRPVVSKKLVPEWMANNKALFPSYESTLASIKNAKDFAVNSQLFCRLTNKLCQEPVVAEDGYFYEKAAITQHLKTNGNKSPVTGDVIPASLINVSTYYKKLCVEIITKKATGSSGTPDALWCPESSQLLERGVFTKDGAIIQKQFIYDNKHSVVAEAVRSLAREYK